MMNGKCLGNIIDRKDADMKVQAQKEPKEVEGVAFPQPPSQPLSCVNQYAVFICHCFPTMYLC
jgi:hypothetical protein